MAWRFKASKYKNAAPIIPKPEACIRDICVGSYQTYGNNITASAAFMAFNWEHTGSSVAVLPIDDCGRKSKTMPLLHAHTDTITDLEFSPFHDGILATSSQDCLVKVWHIPEKGLENSLNESECTFSHKQRRVETIGFHPTADFLLNSTAAGTVMLWDLMAMKEAFCNSEHPEVIQSVSWKQDGTVLATSCKDKNIRILDPRSSSVIQLKASSHQSIKDSRVVWLGNQNRILSTGFDSARLRQVILRDIRNFSNPEKTFEFDCSTGILMPLYDPDTSMLFLAGKGDTTISYMEITDRDPYLIEGLRHTGEQTKGACLVPKRALKVMEGEVNRVLQLTSNIVIPIMYQVPRKTYRDFHSDLYPDTNGFNTDLTAKQWLKGNNSTVPKISLDPAKRESNDSQIIIHRGTLKEMLKNVVNKAVDIPSKDKYTGIKIIETDIEDNQNNIKISSKNDTAKKLSDKYKIFSDTDGFSANNKQIFNKLINNENQYNIEHGTNGIYREENNANSINYKNETTIPPRPLPRTSRNNSIIEFSNSSDESTASRPVAKPRTTTSYKPRLGPKPFTSNSSDVSFDKVFAVPQVPGSNTENDQILRKLTDLVDCYQNSENNNFCEANGENNEIENDAKLLGTTNLRKLSEEFDNKIFESNHLNTSELVNQNEDKVESELNRYSSTRASIAERRRLYENRSKSVQDEKPQSPVLLMRHESVNAPSETPKQIIERRRILSNDKKNDDKENENHIDNHKKSIESITSTKRTSTVFGKVSKFRHLKGTPVHKSTHIENIRNISRQLPGECNGFYANNERVAVPLAGQGGKIAIYELNKPGRLPDGVIPSLVNGNNIMDFQWDPFDNSRLAVACDDGVVRFWKINKTGLTDPTNMPEEELNAHLDKIYFIRFHPLSKDVFLTASYDMTVKIWDLTTLSEKLTLNGHTDQIFDWAWSPCGIFGATVCKDGKIRIYNPRKSESPIREGNGPIGTRGARITWAIDGQYIVATGFDKVSERQINVYNAQKLTAPLNTVSLDVSPAILIPFYDEDSSTLFVTGKGDSTIYVYEITDEEPYICPLSHHRCSSLHQGLSFLTKNHCDVASVEFAKALRLTNNAIEPLSFTVPRIKSDLFQDDLFPPTKVIWIPIMSAEEWFNCLNKKPSKISLQPKGMECLSAIQLNVNNKKIEQPIQSQITIKQTDTDKMKQEQIQKSVSSRMVYSTALEQDHMEGVDENEWTD